jgi:mRNA deadenylase 3'-5' endonuclease subunit Ccr4
LAQHHHHHHHHHYTTYKKRGAVESLRVIDYIFHSPDALRVTHLLVAPPITEFPRWMPDARFPSDHLSLYARFALRGRTSSDTNVTAAAAEVPR